MGMYDSFYLNVTCPHCGVASKLEFQTKMFRCTMEVWNEGDVFEVPMLAIDQGIIYGVYGGCTAPKCEAWEKRYHKGFHGFGRRIYCDILIEHGRIVRALNVRGEE